MKKMLIFITLIFASIILSAIEQPVELMDDSNDSERIMTRLKQLNTMISMK